MTTLLLQGIDHHAVEGKVRVVEHEVKRRTRKSTKDEVEESLGLGINDMKAKISSFGNEGKLWGCNDGLISSSLLDDSLSSFESDIKPIVLDNKITQGTIMNKKLLSSSAPVIGEVKQKKTQVRGGDVDNYSVVQNTFGNRFIQIINKGGRPIENFVQTKCFNDHHEINGRPFGLPLFYNETDNFFTVEDLYCSFECMYTAYLKKVENPRNSERYKNTLSLMHMMHFFVTGESTAKFNNAPELSCLEGYGGTLSIEDYRKSFKICQYIDITNYVAFKSIQLKRMYEEIYI